MQTLTIDILNNKAFKLIQDLESLELIRVRKETHSQENSIDWKSKYEGSMTRQSLTDIDRQLNELRNEWE